MNKLLNTGLFREPDRYRDSGVRASGGVSSLLDGYWESLSVVPKSDLQNHQDFPGQVAACLGRSVVGESRWGSCRVVGKSAFISGDARVRIHVFRFFELVSDSAGCGDNVFSNLCLTVRGPARTIFRQHLWRSTGGRGDLVFQKAAWCRRGERDLYTEVSITVFHSSNISSYAEQWLI